MCKEACVLVLIGWATCHCSAQMESLLISPGDLVEIKVFDTPEMNQHVRVSDAGTIRLNLIGELKISHESPAEAGRSIETALIEKQIMRNPQVSVDVIEFSTEQVYVMGEVQTPGSVGVRTKQPLLQVLSVAGGFTSLADRNVTIWRRGDRSNVVKCYVANDSNKAIAEQVLVYPGDTVLVEKAGIVYVMGDVLRPGGYPINTNDSTLSLLQAIALAGSANKTASVSNVRLIRKAPSGREESTVPLGAIQKGKAPDFALRANDVIYVPFSWARNLAVTSSSIVSSTSSAVIYTIH